MSLNLDYSLLTPEFLLAGLAAVVVGLDLFAGPRFRRDLLPYVSATGLAVIFGVSLGWVNKESDFAGLIVVDNFTTFFRAFFIGVTFFVTLASAQFVRDRLRHPGEYYGLLILSTIGAIYMAAARELLTAYISLELLSFSLYVLVSYAKFDAKSNEGGMKYMLLGAFASALLLYGLSLIYGVAGSTTYSEISNALAAGTDGYSFALLMGLVLILTGLGFKVAAVPFHMWTPDAYEGAPLPITAYLSATSKAAGFALLLRLFSGAFMPAVDDWQWMVAALSAVTMTVGNLIALQQHNIKRLLAYSSIGQVGFMLMGITALSDSTASALVVHMTGYVVTNLAAFIPIIAYYNLTGKDEITDFRGMAERAPFLAASLTIALFSLAGLPIFAGFLTKFILFQAAAEEGFLWLSAAAIVNSVISLYYYLQVIRQLYIEAPPEPGRFAIPHTITGSVAVLVAGVLLIGVFPQPLFDVGDNVTAFLFV